MSNKKTNNAKKIEAEKKVIRGRKTVKVIRKKILHDMYRPPRNVTVLENIEDAISIKKITEDRTKTSEEK